MRPSESFLRRGHDCTTHKGKLVRNRKWNILYPDYSRPILELDDKARQKKEEAERNKAGDMEIGAVDADAEGGTWVIATIEADETDSDGNSTPTSTREEKTEGIFNSAPSPVEGDFSPAKPEERIEAEMKLAMETKIDSSDDDLNDDTVEEICESLGDLTFGDESEMVYEVLGMMRSARSAQKTERGWSREIRSWTQELEPAPAQSSTMWRMPR